MANTYVKIQTITVDASGASAIDFTSIPQTYTDLKIVISAIPVSSDTLVVSFNNSTANFTNRYIEGTGATAVSGTNAQSGRYVGYAFGSSQVANIEVYIPNYTSANNKSFFTDVASEFNQTTAYSDLVASLWSNTAAITSIKFNFLTANFAQYSTATLYGISNVALATSAYATGGNQIYSDATYWYHLFTSDGTFTPNRNLTVDYLVIAGGGGSASSGNNDTSAGGGAGGYRTTVGTSGGGGASESPLSVTSSTNYTVTVGAGGAGEANGSNSVFSTITSTGGGRSVFRNAGVTGGSGGGANGQGTNTAGSGTANQGYAGGTGTFNGSTGTSGGGGGAGAVGTTGAGGNGVTSSISGTSVTRAGGGGGASTAAAQSGGTGGGGTGGFSTHNSGTDGAVSTGSGAGGAWASAGLSATGKNGGSGIVIVRYAK